MKIVAVLVCVLHLAAVTVAGGSLACTCADGARVIEWGSCGCGGEGAPAVPAQAIAPVEDDCPDCADCGGPRATATAAPAPHHDAALHAPGCLKDLPALHTGVELPPCPALARDASLTAPPVALPAPLPAPARVRPDPADSPPPPLRC